MGTYSNINADAIISACDTAISEIDSHRIIDKADALYDGMISSAKSVIYNAVNSAQVSSSNSIYNLKNKINNLKSAMSYVKQYQKDEKTMKYYSDNWYSWKDTSHYETTYDSQGNQQKKWVTSGYKYVKQSTRNGYNNAKKSRNDCEAKINSLLS